ncbi:deoxyribose-phosphate aldolase [Harryflintia acetispora]|uniref:deoxyribose-phosphate aldolase n=1 Tax=Harryflintia acetispora TaxID=1849041 RepID=UPI0018986988|nr:deoxyribose-phosphate aldolase [Harryflintia acetispora]
MPVNGTQFAHMLDGTLIHSTSTLEQTRELLDYAKKYHFHCVFGPRPFYPVIAEALRGTDVHFGCGCGDNQPSYIKAEYAKNGLSLGCNEFDMVINLPYFKSGMYREVVEDIRVLRDTVGDHILKCIIETPLLSDEEIEKAVELVIEGGADFVKTAVGRDGPTTVHHIEVVSRAAKGRIQIKASGGIRDLETVDQMIELGVTRFGVSYQSGLAIMQAADNR